MRARNPLHVRCGDDILAKLKAAGLPGRMMKWCDPVCVGPTPAGLSSDEWYAVRAAFLGLDSEAELRGQDAALASFRDHDAIVLWFEHDLFDQAILIRLLDWFAHQDTGATEVWLVSSARFLGNREAVELARLYETAAARVTEDQMRLATRAWDAWCSPDPRNLESIMRGEAGALPHLAVAVGRHLEDFPSTRNGLGRTEQTALEIIAAGATEPRAVFREFQHREEAAWMGDSMLFGELDRLANLPAPLLDRDGRITVDGRAILEGRADALAVNSPDRWVAGVHLCAGNIWRWDADRRSVIRDGT